MGIYTAFVEVHYYNIYNNTNIIIIIVIIIIVIVAVRSHIIYSRN